MSSECLEGYNYIVDIGLFCSEVFFFCIYAITYLLYVIPSCRLSCCHPVEGGAIDGDSSGRGNLSAKHDALSTIENSIWGYADAP